MKSQDTNKPNYYAILTADVRYDNRLNATQKLLFAELTALSNTHGFAFPSNEYLATLYGVSELTISRNIAKLNELNYIKIEVTKTAKGSVRKIYIKDTLPPIKNDESPLIKNDKTPHIKNDKCITINNTRDLILQESNIESNDNKLYKNKPKSVEITLSLIEKMYKENDFKRFNYERFYNHYSIQNWKHNNGNDIHLDHIPKMMRNWEISENSHQTVNNDEVKIPDHLKEYYEELKEMKG